LTNARLHIGKKLISFDLFAFIPIHKDFLIGEAPRSAPKRGAPIAAVSPTAAN
jgi:hypothetical protein